MWLAFDLTKIKWWYNVCYYTVTIYYLCSLKPEKLLSDLLVYAKQAKVDVFDTLQYGLTCVPKCFNFPYPGVF